MDLEKAIDIVQQCIDNTSTTVKDARLIVDAWEKIISEVERPKK